MWLFGIFYLLCITAFVSSNHFFFFSSLFIKSTFSLHRSNNLLCMFLFFMSVIPVFNNGPHS